MKNYLLLLLTIVLISCVNETKLYDTGDTLSIRNKNLFSYDWLTIYDTTGNKFAEGYVEDDGIPRNKWNGFYPDGSLYWQCEYDDSIKLDSIFSTKGIQMTCYDCKWMKQYYESGALYAEYKKIDSLWMEKFFYENGQVQAFGKRNKSDMPKGAWNYYYPDGEMSHSLVYENGKSADIPCERVPIDMQMSIRKEEGKEGTIFYYRFHTKNIDPEKYTTHVVQWGKHDSMPPSIINPNQEGKFSFDNCPYRFKLENSMIRNFGGEDDYVCIAVEFDSPHCEHNPNNQLFIMSVNDLSQREGLWFYDEQLGRFLIQREDAPTQGKQ